MKFSVVINRWPNFYFFLQNLSEWHYRCRKSYNDLWRKELGPFSFEAEEALKMFKEVHSRYSYGETYLANYFLTASTNPWIGMKNKVSPEDLKSLRDIFERFEEKFELLYRADLPFLREWEKKLTERLKDEKINREIIKALSILYGVLPVEKEVSVYLLFSSERDNGGRFYMNQNCITVELSRLPISRINHAIGIVWHELIHLYFDHINFIPMLSKKIEDWKTIHLLKEIAAGSLLPKGILGIKFLGTSFSGSGKLLPEIKAESTSDVLELTAQYLNDGRSFGENYVSKIMDFLKK